MSCYGKKMLSNILDLLLLLQ